MRHWSSAPDGDGRRDASRAGMALPVNASSRDHRLGIGVWEGESVVAVREVVERAVGAYADNEYYEMEVELR